MIEIDLDAAEEGRYIPVVHNGEPKWLVIVSEGELHSVELVLGTRTGDSHA